MPGCRIPQDARILRLRRCAAQIHAQLQRHRHHRTRARARPARAPPGPRPVPAGRSGVRFSPSPTQLRCTTPGSSRGQPHPEQYGRVSRKRFCAAGTSTTTAHRNHELGALISKPTGPARSCGSFVFDRPGMQLQHAGSMGYRVWNSIRFRRCRLRFALRPSQRFADPCRIGSMHQPRPSNPVPKRGRLGSAVLLRRPRVHLPQQEMPSDEEMDVDIDEQKHSGSVNVGRGN